MAARTFEFILTSFEFPAALPDRKANFRMITDLRFVSRRGEHTAVHSVLPGLDAWWECDPGRSDDLGYVRGGRNGTRVAMAVDAISDWDRLILLVRGDGIHSIQFRVYDVNRADPWDRVKGLISDVVPALAGRGRAAVPAVDGLFDAALGSASEDLASFALARLAGGDSLLFRGSTRLTGPGPMHIGGHGVAGEYRLGFEVHELA